MTKMKEAALEYAAKGWPVFPCKADKTPYTANGVLDATTNPKQIYKWWDIFPNANIGFAVGDAGLATLDFDPGHNFEDVQSILQDDLKTNLIAKTPRGGYHYTFALAKGEHVPPSASKIAEHVDVRSFNSYILLPPSRTKDGEYTWISQGKPAYRPEKLVELSKQARAKDKDRDKWIIEPDLPENVEAAIIWAKKEAKVAIEGVNGDHRAYATAAMMKSFGLSPETAFEVMWEHWNPRCIPPWKPDEAEHLEQKIINGYSYNTSPPGNMTDAYQVAKRSQLFKPVTRETKGGGSETIVGPFRIVDRDGLESIEPPEWLIPGVLPQNSLALLIGTPGSFKTFIALDMALSIASGGCDYFQEDESEWKGMWPVVNGSGPVLFAAGEGRASLRNRVSAWEQAHVDGNRIQNFKLIDPVLRPEEEQIELFIEAAKKKADEYSLIVIDTVSRSLQGLNENAQQDVSTFTRMCQELQYRLNCAVLALHHLGHTGDRARGSSVFQADVDAEFIVDRENKENIVRIRNTKQKDAVEWEKPKFIQLSEVLLRNGQKSLVALKPTKHAEQKAKQSQPAPKNQKNRSTDKDVQLNLALLRKVAYHMLKRYPSKEYTTRALAVALSAQEEISIGVEQLRKKYIGELLADKGHPFAKCFDDGKGVYVFRK